MNERSQLTLTDLESWMNRGPAANPSLLNGTSFARNHRIQVLAIMFGTGALLFISMPLWAQLVAGAVSGGISGWAGNQSRLWSIPLFPAGVKQASLKMAFGLTLALALGKGFILYPVFFDVLTGLWLGQLASGRGENPVQQRN
ncbi:MAG TPA: hypothetical protein VGL56_07300 [Fimbriimonadaceae bacterium]|jgi:hypothetical protein